MGRYRNQPSYIDTETDNTSSSVTVEALKQKRKRSILKKNPASTTKEKCDFHSGRSNLEDTSTSRKAVKETALRGILKKTKDSKHIVHEHEKELARMREREKYDTSSADDDYEQEEPRVPYPNQRCLVGRVPHPIGSKPGRGGGLALIVRKNLKTVSHPIPQQNIMINEDNKKHKRKSLFRKRSY